MNLGEVLRIIFGTRGKKKTSTEFENRWLKHLFVRGAVLFIFTITFLYLRLKLNKTPPIFSGKLKNISKGC